jgi:ribulose-phosphate 3-epimerase
MREYPQQPDFLGEEVVELGVALGLDTPIDAIAPFIHAVNFVQFMGIAKIGYQGQPFDERVICRIKNLRGAHSEVIISVDGGVNLETAPLLLEAGADRLVVGSAIFESGDIKKTIAHFQTI